MKHWLAGLTLMASCAIGGPAFAADANEAAYLADSKAAMSSMMANMDAPPAGDVDADFVAGMIPHHQGAIAMAKAELRYGHNKKLRRMAQEIIAKQEQEIAEMRQALGKPVPAATHP
jgi:uncharacterized protein (DUF305 family)